jgi:hypothetical protein
MENESIKEHILGLISDTISDLLYYDRKEDDDLPRGAIEAAIKRGDITVDEIVAKFKEELEQNLSDE